MQAVPFASSESVDRLKGIAAQLFESQAVPKSFKRKFDSSWLAFYLSRIVLPLSHFCFQTNHNSRGLKKALEEEEIGEAEEAAAEAKKKGVSSKADVYPLLYSSSLSIVHLSGYNTTE